MQGNDSIVEVKRVLFEETIFQSIRNEFIIAYKIILSEKDLTQLAENKELCNEIFCNLAEKIFNAKVYCYIKEYRNSHLSRVLLKQEGNHLQLRTMLNNSRKNSASTAEKIIVDPILLFQAILTVVALPYNTGKDYLKTDVCEKVNINRDQNNIIDFNAIKVSLTNGGFLIIILINFYSKVLILKLYKNLIELIGFITAPQSSIITPLLDFSLPSLLGINVSASTIPSSLTNSSLHILVEISAPLLRKNEILNYFKTTNFIDRKSSNKKIRIPFKDLQTNMQYYEFEYFYNKFAKTVLSDIENLPIPNPKKRKNSKEINKSTRSTKKAKINNIQLQNKENIPIGNDSIITGSSTELTHASSSSINNSSVPLQNLNIIKSRTSKKKKQTLKDSFESINTGEDDNEIGIRIDSQPDFNKKKRRIAPR